MREAENVRREDGWKENSNALCCFQPFLWLIWNRGTIGLQ